MPAFSSGTVSFSQVGTALFVFFLGSSFGVLLACCEVDDDGRVLIGSAAVEEEDEEVRSSWYSLTYGGCYLGDGGGIFEGTWAFLDLAFATKAFLCNLFN